MDAKLYLRIQAFVKKNLIPGLQSEAEDATQFVALGAVLRPTASWKHLLIDWLRETGHGDRGKAGGKAIARSVRVGQGNDEETGAREALLDVRTVEDFERPEERPAAELIEERVEEFLGFIGIPEGESKWLAKKFLESERTKNLSRSQKKEDWLFNV